MRKTQLVYDVQGLILALMGQVFKLVGPALVRQDLEEARQNVDKRIGYINGELKR